MTPRARTCAAIIALTVQGWDVAGQSPATPRDRLLVAVMVFEARAEAAISALAEKARSRLEAACPAQWPNRDGCVTRNLPSERHKVADLHASPSADSPIVGAIHAVVRSRSDEFAAFAIGLDLEFARSPGRFQEWIDDVGDWGYGIHIDGNVRIRRGWVQLVEPVIPLDAWIPAIGSELSVIVDGIEGQILDIQAVRATLADGTITVTEKRPYLITRVTDDAVEFRAKVDSDFPCEGDEKPPDQLPPIMRAAPAEFFTPDGASKFSTTYARGC